MNIRTKSIRIKGKRCLVISDIHAHLEVLKELLHNVNYQAGKDTLILLGDIVEKGKESLATLHYVMELAAQENVYVVMGNCDAIACVVVDREKTKGIFHYVLNAPWKQHTLLHEMCEEQGITLTEASDIDAVFDQLYKAYPSEFEFLIQLPHVVESEEYIFAHAGLLKEEAPFADDPYQIMKNDYFAVQDVHFHKTLVCGHTPVMNYSKTYLDCNPQWDAERNILSIDGGCGVKEYGQLNVIVLEDDAYATSYLDELKEIDIINDYEPKCDTPAHAIVFMDNQIQRIQEDEDSILCRSSNKGFTMCVPKDYVYETADGWHCNDFSDFHLAVRKGDKVHYIETWKEEVLVKKEGIIGWIPKDCIAHPIK